MRTTLRFALAAVFGAPLIPGSAFAQKEHEPRVIHLDEGISVRVPPIWQSRPLAGTLPRQPVARRRGEAHVREEGRL